MFAYANDIKCRAGTCPRRGTTKSAQIHSSVPSAAYADGTPGRRALRSVYRSCSVGRDHWARRCRNYRLRTNPFVCAVSRFADGTPGRRALRAAYRSCSVGRDHWARRCRNYRLRTNLFVCTVCRFAVGGHMCPPYIGIVRSTSVARGIPDALLKIRSRGEHHSHSLLVLSP